jgi:hypothetical protein
MAHRRRNARPTEASRPRPAHSSTRRAQPSLRPTRSRTQADGPPTRRECGSTRAPRLRPSRSWAPAHGRTGHVQALRAHRLTSSPTGLRHPARQLAPTSGPPPPRHPPARTPRLLPEPISSGCQRRVSTTDPNRVGNGPSTARAVIDRPFPTQFGVTGVFCPKLSLDSSGGATQAAPGGDESRHPGGTLRKPAGPCPLTPPEARPGRLPARTTAATPAAHSGNLPDLVP